jgi:hypothetical protein
MWLFTQYGFFSIAVYRPGRVQIRARAVAHLQRLKLRFGWKDRIRRTRPADYPYRLEIDQERWAHALWELAREQTWSNVKGAAGRAFGPGDPYTEAMHAVWAYLACNLEEE